MTVGALILAMQVAAAELPTTAAASTSSMVSARVLPILDTLQHAIANDIAHTPEGEKHAYLLADLFDDQTPAADEALAILTWMYLGEAPGEDLHHQISTRGRRMLPYLIKYRVRCPQMLERYPVTMRLRETTRRSLLRSLMRSMRKGEVVGDD